jgi:hypothetical protein
MSSLLDQNEMVAQYREPAIIHGDVTEHHRPEKAPERWVRDRSVYFKRGASGRVHLERLENPKEGKKKAVRVVKVIPEEEARDNEVIFFREVKAMATCRRREVLLLL